MKLPLKKPIKIRGHIRDLMAFRELVPQRRQRFANASSQPDAADPMRELVRQLHPTRQHLQVTEIREETPSTRTYRLEPNPEAGSERLAYFRAGQYISLKLVVDGFAITRPYTLSSAPSDALNGFYELTIKLRDGGFFTAHLREQWRVGTLVETSGPAGFFYYDPLRDHRHLVALAGGCGITPFRSLAREIVFAGLDAQLTILYGSVAATEIIFRTELEDLQAQAPDRLRVIHVLSGEGEVVDGCDSGFLNADLIKRHLGEEAVAASSFFICGPQVMYEFLHKELTFLGIPRRQIRREVYGEPTDITKTPGFPAETANHHFAIKAWRGRQCHEIAGAATESVLVALERAKLSPDAECRSGECGLCRTRLVHGDLFFSPHNDGRREADRNLGCFHACAAYPVSDLEIELLY